MTRALVVVKWSKSFPKRGQGTYKVTWSQGGTKLGPTLRFTQR